MRADKSKIDLVMARNCVGVMDIVKISKVPEPTARKILQEKEVLPATMGRFAKALGVDVTEIITE